jgi:DNA-binding CsgD family transcriptional regulator
VAPEVASPSLVGRDREVEALRRAITQAAAGHGQVVLLEGEPGIGKTRLVEAACDHAQRAGFEVAAGGCDDLAPARPFAAILAALSITADSVDAERSALAALIDTHDDSEPASAESAHNPGLQYRVMDALGALVERLATRAPLILALDDLQWADASTLVALRSIARRVETLPVVILGACRVGHQSTELHRVADDLLRDGGARLAVGPLDAAAVTTLVAQVLQASPSDSLLASAQGANGNPLFLIEYVRSAREHGAETATEFRMTVLRRLSTLSEATNDALRLASVLGSTFRPSDLALASGRSVVELAPALHQAVVAAMLEERDDRLAFRHMLVRDAIYEHIPLAVRRQLHREVGRSIAAAGSDALAVGHHLGLAADQEDPEAVSWLRRAAREVAARSPEVAVELLERARGLLGPHAPVRQDLLVELAVALAWSGRLADAEKLGVEVLRNRPDPVMAGALRCGLVYALMWQGKAREALPHTVLDPDEHLSDWDAALLRAEAAVASVLAFDFKAGAAHASVAIEEAERLGHSLAHCHALTAMAWATNFAGRPEEAVTLARQAIDIADRDPTGEANLAHPRFFPGMPLLSLDRIDEAEEALSSGLRIAEDLGLAWSLPLYHAFLGAKGYIIGDWDGAVAECEAALAIADEVGLHVGVMAAASAWLAVIQLRRDDLAAAERTVATAMGLIAVTGPQLGMGPLNWARALVYEARNEYDEALAVLQTAFDLYQAGGPETDPELATKPMTDPWTPMAFVRLCVATGDRDRAAAVLPTIDRHAVAVPIAFMQGQAIRCRALVEQDPDAMVDAVALYRASPRPDELGAACEDAGVLLASAKRLEEAAPLWEEAIGLYERLGADRDVARVLAQLRSAGVKRGSRRPHVRATSGWESLTETEHKVVALVAQRLSNPEVAERLFISRHTVESHLKHIYRKLGLSSRLELAALADQRSTVGG